jgi:thiol:disulfide interchange protein
MPPDEPRAATAPGADRGSRSDPKILMAIAAVLLVARVGLGIYTSKHPVGEPDRVNWQPVEFADSLARAEKKPILYEFSADWCAPCQTMQKEIFSDREGADRIDKLFVPVRVVDRMREEGRNRPEVAGLQARFGVRAFPTLVVVHPDVGEPAVLAGYQGRDYTLDQLTRAAVPIITRLGATAPALPDSGPLRLP